MTAAVTVFVADDHPVFREGLINAWAAHPGLSVIGQAGDGVSAFEQITSQQPQVAIIDFKLPERDGLEVLEQLTQTQSPTAVILLTAYVDRTIVLRAFELGALGFLEKAASVEEITNAVLRVARGETVMAPYAQSVMARDVRERHEFRDAPNLTRRELQILKAAAEGHSNSAIAKKLHISITTVKTHLQHVYEKLSVSDRSSAVAKAFRRGLLD